MTDRVPPPDKPRPPAKTVPPTTSIPPPLGQRSPTLIIITHSPAYIWPTLLILGCAFAMANGFAYGTGNHWQYLLHGRHLLDPTFLANDWLASQTQTHHAAFAWMIAILGKLTSLDVALAWANAVFAVICFACIYAITARFFRTPIVVTAVTILIIAFSPRSTIGMSSLIMPYFQPSTIGGVGLLAGLTCLLYARYKTAGAILLITGLFHLSYTVWGGVILGAVIILNWKEIGLRRAIYLLAPIALSAAFHAHFVLASRTPEQTTYAAAASRILHDIYMPGHSRPRTWGLDPFIRFGLTLAAGLIAAIGGERNLGRIAASILGVLGGIIGVGILFTTAIQSDLMALLLPYRLAPLLILAAHIACAGALVTTAQSSRFTLLEFLALWGGIALLLYGSGIESIYGLACIFAAVVGLLGKRFAKERKTPLWLIGAIAAGLLTVIAIAGAGKTGVGCAGVFLAAGIAWRAFGKSTGARTRARGILSLLPYAGRAVIPLLIGMFLMQVGAARKDFLGPLPPDNEQTLYAWCRIKTNRDDVFIIPPWLSNFRLWAERAIVIDTRCIGITPSETVEWYRRLVDECGTDFKSFSEANAAYLTMDAERAIRVGNRYGAAYVITQHDEPRKSEENHKHRGDMTALPQVYTNEIFTVYALPRPPASP